MINFDLLHQQKLMTGQHELPAFAAHDYQWDEEKNNQLLELGFEQYVKNTKEILDEKPANPAIHKVRDLSIKQQHALLQLTDDLKYIGAPRPGVLDTTSNVRLLGDGISRLMRDYRSSWFISTARKGQLSTLQSRLNVVLNSNGPQSRYEKVLHAIRDAKFAAINADRAHDEQAWFRTNRGGRSRYFNTLNQMQDLVLRQWVQDVPALHSFQAYQQFSREEFLMLATQLCERVVSYDAQTYLLPDDPRNKQIGRQISHFFRKPDDEVKLKSLKRVLETFTRAHNVMNWENVPAADVLTLIDELRTDLPRLPGHLATLANELLARGDSLVRHLLEKEGAMNPGGNHFGGAPAQD